MQDGVPAPVHHPCRNHPKRAWRSFRMRPASGGSAAVESHRGERTAEHLIHRDNTFGTPEEDAFRRDFTINALFYDIANFSIIDYVGGLDDLRAGLVRSIGDPDVRLKEDPVRMIRAIALAARLDFTIEPTLLDSIRAIVRRSRRARCPGCSRSTTRSCGRDRRRRRSAAWRRWASCSRSPRSCTRARPSRSGRRSRPSTRTAAGSTRRPTRCRTGSCSAACSCRSAFVRWARGRSPIKRRRGRLTRWRPGRQQARIGGTGAVRGPRLGELPLARRDIERLRLIVSLQRRLRDLSASPKAQTRARPSRHLPRGADLAGNSRRRARARRALEGDSGRGRRHGGDGGGGAGRSAAPAGARRRCRSGGGDAGGGARRRPAPGS